MVTSGRQNVSKRRLCSIAKTCTLQMFQSEFECGISQTKYSESFWVKTFKPSPNFTLGFLVHRNCVCVCVHTYVHARACPCIEPTL